MHVMGTYSRRFQSTTSVLMGGGWWGVRRNVLKLTLYTLYGWSAALVPVVACAVGGMRRREWPQRWEKPTFLFLWIAPALIFYALIHMGQQGLTFVYLPALLLISAVGLSRLLAAQPRGLMAATAVLAALGAGVFLLAPEYPLGHGTQRLLTRTTLVNSDRYYGDRFRAIEDNLAVGSTAILAANWRHVEYYLPRYAVLPFGVVGKWEKGEGEPRGNPQEVVATPTELGLHTDGQGQVAIVIFDPYLMAFSDSPTAARELELEHGGGLGYLVLARGQAFRYGSRSFGIAGD
jgi:hypothetical protein